MRSSTVKRLFLSLSIAIFVAGTLAFVSPKKATASEQYLRQSTETTSAPVATNAVVRTDMAYDIDDNCREDEAVHEANADTETTACALATRDELHNSEIHERPMAPLPIFEIYLPMID